MTTYVRPLSRPGIAPVVNLPMDVRLMNMTAVLLVVLSVLTLLVAMGSWLVRQPGFAIRAIRVDGDVARNSVHTIRANAVPRLSGSFFTADLQVARRAFESVPWVRGAVVRREWPGRLHVTLTEHKPVALWGESALLNSYGEVFEANVGDVDEDKLARLDGPTEAAPQALELYRSLVPLFEKGETGIERLSVNARGSWSLALDSGLQMELGRGTPSEVLARTQRFLDTATQVSQRYRQPIVYADLRHVDGYAVRLRGMRVEQTLPAKTGER
jgi:cell division protein FtsQ